jgi:nickel-dependent lactate racemase
MSRIELPYGQQKLSITVPDPWLGQIVMPQAVDPAPDPHALVDQALKHPVGTLPLHELVKPGKTVAILVDDYTRKTPISLILPLVLASLESGEVRPADIRIVVALGTHRPMTFAELVVKLGEKIVAEFQVVNVRCTDESEMVYLGTSNGIPAWVNRAVAEADVRVGLGMITPHMDAGFSGGAKIVLPGVCSATTVDAFHAASAFLPVNQLGNENAPLRYSLEQFVAERVPVHFIVNVVVTLAGQVYDCVAGHPVEAHRAGAKRARAVFGVPVGHRYPVVVANCYPYDIDLWQSFKGAFCGNLLTAGGGTLVLVTAAPEGNSTYPLVPCYAGRDMEELKHEIEAGQAEDAKQAVAGIQFGILKRQHNLSLVSGGLTQTDAATMGIPYFATAEAAMADAVGRLSASEEKGSVAVVPQAGIVLPLLR